MTFFGPKGKLAPILRAIFWALAGVALYVGIFEGNKDKAEIIGFAGCFCLALSQVSLASKKDKPPGQ